MKFEILFSYPGVEIKDFTNSWRDGLAFNALIHKFRSNLFDYNELLVTSPKARHNNLSLSESKIIAERNLEHAFNTAQKHLQIERLLDIEDVITEYPDKKSIMMYVMCYFQVLSKPQVALIEDTSKESTVMRFFFS